MLAAQYSPAVLRQLQIAAERAALEVWLNPQASLRAAVRQEMEKVATGSVSPSPPPARHRPTRGMRVANEHVSPELLRWPGLAGGFPLVCTADPLVGPL